MAPLWLFTFKLNELFEKRANVYVLEVIDIFLTHFNTPFEHSSFLHSMVQPPKLPFLLL